jgi:hypothetical protein
MSSLEQGSFISADSSMVDRYIQLLVSYASIAQKFGVSIVPFTDNTIRRYASFDHEKQETTYRRLLDHYQLCVTATQNEIDLNDNKHSLTCGPCARCGCGHRVIYFNI